jgi:putative addiction module killer protein
LKEIIAFDNNGKEPFTDWFGKLKDKKTKAKILTRLERVANNNYGYHRRLKADFLELKEKMSGGIRIYLGEDGDNLIVLLLGGNKSSQEQDIAKALQYWQEYKSNN